MDEKETLDEPVPKNRAGDWKIGSVRIRSFIEAAILIIPVVGIIVSIPFILKIKIALCCFFGVGILIISLIGIRNRTLSEAFYAHIKHKINRRCLKLGSVIDENRADIFKRNTNKSFSKEAKDYFSDDNLRESDDTKKILAKGVKQFVTNIKDAFGL